MANVLVGIASWYQRQPRWVRRLFLGADTALGAIIFHDRAGQEKTISKHLAEDRDQGGLIGTVGCTVLDAADPDHCDRVKS